MFDISFYSDDRNSFTVYGIDLMKYSYPLNIEQFVL